jgi:transposase
MLTNKQLTNQIAVLDSLIDNYKLSRPEIKRDFSKYESSYLNRIKVAIDFFEKLTRKAIKLTNFSRQSKIGRPEKLTLEQRVKILLIQKYMQRSNREMSEMLLLFAYLQGINVSYKTIERLYDDQRIRIVLLNMNSLILKELNITSSHASGDGTGFMLSIKEHYASSAQRLKEKGKVNSKKRKTFFSFTLMDVEKRIYLAYGTSYQSERDAYNNAIEMLDKTNIHLNSVRLDRYYSGQTLVKTLSEEYEGIKCYLIPKKGTLVRGSLAWKKMLSEFCNKPDQYFNQYFKRNQSESGFSEDKRRFGWRIPQKIAERIDMAYFSIFTWHNLLWLGQ